MATLRKSNQEFTCLCLKSRESREQRWQIETVLYTPTAKDHADLETDVGSPGEESSAWFSALEKIPDKNCERPSFVSREPDTAGDSSSNHRSAVYGLHNLI